MARVLSFLIRYFSNYYALHRSDLAARAAPLDPRLLFMGLRWLKNSYSFPQNPVRFFYFNPYPFPPISSTVVACE